MSLSPVARGLSEFGVARRRRLALAAAQARPLEEVTFWNCVDGPMIRGRRMRWGCWHRLAQNLPKFSAVGNEEVHEKSPRGGKD
jgi:hypothetical protein